MARPRGGRSPKTIAAWRALLASYDDATKDGAQLKEQFLRERAGDDDRAYERLRKQLDNALNFAWRGGAKVPVIEMMRAPKRRPEE